MSYPRPPRRDGPPRATMRLRDLALDDRERAFYGPRMGDWMLLGLMVVILLGNGAYIWHQTGLGSHVGRAAFFGLLLLCILWAALVYTFKLSVCVRVGPQGLSVVRGPWRTELAWREVARLTERAQMIQGQRYRWLVALARDGRKMQIRDDMVDDYARFRIEVYERYRLWRDHGGTWGTTGGGPFTAKERLAGQTFWAAVSAVALVLMAIYFLVLLPETDPLGWIMLLLVLVCAVISVRGLLRRTTYTVDAKSIEARQKTRALKLAWRNVAKVERTRHAFGGIISMGIAVGRFALKLAARTDGRVESFDWAPRVPEYLTLRGGGHQVRVRLHRLERPDELLAWVEFYERVGRRATGSGPLRKTGGPTRQLEPEPETYAGAGVSGAHLADIHAEPAPPDLTGTTGPIDPWGAGRDGELETYHASPGLTDQTAGEDDWLRGSAPRRRTAAPAAEQTSPTPLPPLPPFSASTPHAPEQDAREQSLSGLDVFASRPARDTIPPSFAAPWEQDWEQDYGTMPASQLLPEHTSSPIAPPEASFQEPPSAPSAPSAPRWRRADSAPDVHSAAPQAPQYQQPHGYDPYERQAPRVMESWQPEDAEDAARHWQPAPEPEPDVPENDWLAGQGDAEAEEDAPTEAIESLADSFAPWRDDANWQPPQLPRFGPPARGDSER